VSRARGGSHMIEIDADVWAAIRAEAEPFVDQTPNSVLRRVLGEGMPRPVPTGAGTHRGAGALKATLDRGALRPGDLLLCIQPRRKRTFRATVTADGWIAVIDPPNGEFDRPSPALRACTGGQINGWTNWIVDRTGKPLEDYR
jgi:hypothetical protein